jgi:hypothetical protein
MQFQIDHPNAFPGDSIDFLRCIYRNPDLDLAVRIDAAGKAARYERPTLAAVAVREISPQPSGPGATSDRIAELLEKGLARGVTIDATAVADGVGGLESAGALGVTEPTGDA